MNKREINILFTRVSKPLLKDYFYNLKNYRYLIGKNHVETLESRV